MVRLQPAAANHIVNMHNFSSFFLFLLTKMVPERKKQLLIFVTGGTLLSAVGNVTDNVTDKTCIH